MGEELEGGLIAGGGRGKREEGRKERFDRTGKRKIQEKMNAPQLRPTSCILLMNPTNIKIIKNQNIAEKRKIHSGGVCRSSGHGDPVRAVARGWRTPLGDSRRRER